MDRLSNQQIAEAGLADWRKLAQALHARFVASDAGSAAAFVVEVVEVVAAADAVARRPDVRLTGPVVDVAVCTREDGLWVTSADVEVAAQISALAQDRGLESRPGEVTQLELALDTADEPALGRFWSALLTGSPDNTVHDSVLDPTGRVPSLWFQSTEPHDVPRQRWHHDLWLAPETASERIAAAVAAGGTVVDVSWAPTFVVLADPEGNRVCVCTSVGRD